MQPFSQRRIIKFVMHGFREHVLFYYNDCTFGPNSGNLQQGQQAPSEIKEKM
jgi:hypothetical protein